MSGASMSGQLDCAPAVLVEIREHVAGALEREVGGFLAGRLRGGHARVELAIPALRAAGSRTNVTFTHEVWDEALTQLDREHPDLQLVGWYHSHPGFGIFLSEYDQFIQRNFFPADGMVALVVDPHTGAEGWFITRDGEITRGDGEEPVELPRDRPSKPSMAVATSAGETRGEVRRGAFVMLGVGTLLAGFVAGWLTGAGERGVDPLSERLQEARAEQAELASALEGALERAEQAERAAASATDDRVEPDAQSSDAVAEPDGAPVDEAPATEPLLRYRVRSGDTLSQLAAALDPEPERYLQRILEANPELEDPDLITVGSELRLPLPAPLADVDADTSSPPDTQP